MFKARRFPESNYKAVFANNQTMRFAIDNKKPILELEYPEFYDISITGKCKGNCVFCYQDSKKTNQHYENITEKVKFFFGNMTENQKPLQCAVGGGEPTSHPDFIKLLKTFHDLGIMPNYTTNGMFLGDGDKKVESIMKATEKYCGGVALSCHPHLEWYWQNAANIYRFNHIAVNFHIIISDKQSIDYFAKIYKNWKDKIEYFVLLPYSSSGRAPKKEVDWAYLCKKLPRDSRKIAFGANFYPYLKDGKNNIDVILYEPEIMSKYITLEGNGKMYKSSFSKKPIKENLFPDF